MTYRLSIELKTKDSSQNSTQAAAGSADFIGALDGKNYSQM